MFSLEGKRALVIGLSDPYGYGWVISRSLSSFGVKIYIGAWSKTINTFKKHISNSDLSVECVYPVDLRFDSPEEKDNRRPLGDDIGSLCKLIKKELGTIDYLVHSAAYSPAINKTILEISRSDYLETIGVSAYSFISLIKHFGPIFNKDGAAITMSYIASSRVIPSYGGGMSSAKAALENDVRVLAYEAGQKWQIRINCISPGILLSHSAKAIKGIDNIKSFYENNTPIHGVTRDASKVGDVASFLLSPLASSITGTTIYADNGFHVMGMPREYP